MEKILASVANVSELINQLIGLSSSHTKSENEKEQLICQCSIGKLRLNADSKNEYRTVEQCNKGFVCYFVATEKHLAGKLSHGLNMKIDNKFVSRISSKDVVNSQDIHIRIELDPVDSIFL